MSPARRLTPFLLLLFTSTLGNSAIVPFMPFFMVDGLGQPPWMLSVYGGLAVSLTVVLNRIFARRIDGGAQVFPIIGIAVAGYALASLSMALSPTLPVMLTLGVLGYGLSATSISAMFATGGHMAERAGIPRTKFNAWMRATTSTAWMIGPAVSFSLSGVYGPHIVFQLACGLAVLWAVVWRIGLPRDITAPAPPKPPADLISAPSDLWLAAAFIFCLSIAHGLTFSALPLFFVQEVGLPDFAPGAAFSVKTFVEVIAIFSSSFLIARFGLRAPLMVCTCLAVAAILVLSSVKSLPQMALGSALEGLYYGLFASLGISYIQSFAQDRPAQATAIYWNTLMISGLLAAPAVGLIAQLTDFRTVLLIASGVAALAIPTLLIGIRHARRP
ncbi:MFS transporter [Gymnodinialimonas hymeniacidonis]|uniref:MFS transporter n=1 Tax=Gymnodinialimonas hymeniacidonis TaxID=3126508 RepID=UPI0034C6193E